MTYRLVNKSTANLTADQQEAIRTAAEILTEAFDADLWKVVVNAHKNDVSRVYGVAVAFTQDDL